MIVCWLLIIAFCLWKIQFSFVGKGKQLCGGKNYADYMSLEKTTSVKGIFILLVLTSHISTAVTLSDSVLNSLFFKINFSVIGQSVVTLFLFYSGYGVMLSVAKKGSDYVKSIPKMRFLKVLFHFDAAVILFIILQTILGEKYTLLHLLLSFTGWESVGNSNWYIFIILILYLITYVSFSVFKKKKRYAMAAVFVLTIILIWIMSMSQVKGLYWYDTMILYPVGMLYFLIKDKAEKILRYDTVYYGTLLVLLTAFVWSDSQRNIFLILEIKHILFAAIVIMITMKVQINNKILNFCGRHLFSIYILHRLPMTVLNTFGLNEDPYIYIYIFITVAVTMALCVPFDFLMNMADKKLFKRKRTSDV